MPELLTLKPDGNLNRSMGRNTRLKPQMKKIWAIIIRYISKIPTQNLEFYTHLTCAEFIKTSRLHRAKIHTRNLFSFLIIGTLCSFQAYTQRSAFSYKFFFLYFFNSLWNHKLARSWFNTHARCILYSYYIVIFVY